MKNIDDNNYDDLIKNSEKLVIKFEADWCGPCRMIAPIFEELSTEYPNIEIVKCNVDKSPNVAVNYGIRNLPTILFIKNGEVVNKQVGALPKSTYKNIIETL